MKIRLAAFALLASACAHAEDVTAAFTKCAVTKDDRARLACYDGLRDALVKKNSSPEDATRYRMVDFADLKVDAKELVGRRVSTVAWIQVIGSMSMLKSDEMDMAPLLADVEKLPRDDRKKLANGCQMIMCKGQFYGVVRQDAMGPRLVVDLVAWR